MYWIYVKALFLESVQVFKLAFKIANFGSRSATTFSAESTLFLVESYFSNASYAFYLSR
jgi:hypothetical protein